MGCNSSPADSWPIGNIQTLALLSTAAIETDQQLCLCDLVSLQVVFGT